MGELDPWAYPSLHYFTNQEVYVLRLRMKGASLREPRDALVFVRSAGSTQNLGLDVRAVALLEEPGGELVLDLVMTREALYSPWPWMGDDAEAMRQKIAADPNVLARFPSLAISTAVFGELVAPADAIDHWRAQPKLWDHALGQGGHGGPTDSFATPAEYSVVRGRADDGKRAVPWRAEPPPGLGPSGARPADRARVAWIVLAAALALGAVVISRARKGTFR